MRGRTWALATMVAAVEMLVLSAVPAAADPTKQRWSDLELSAAAVQPYLAIDQTVDDYPLVSLGYSGVRLHGDPHCTATAAGYWLFDETGHYPDLLRDGIPRRPKVKNPTAAKVVRPQPPSEEGFEGTDAEPTVLAPGTRAAASCTQRGDAGRATSELYEGPGPRLAGSAITAGIDRAGTYQGTARSFVQDSRLSAGGALSGVTSLLQVRWPAGAAEPTVTYRLTLTRVVAGAAPGAAADSDEVTLAGTDVPAHQLAAQFAAQRAALTYPLASLAEVRVLGPTAAPAQQNRYGNPEYMYLVTAPSVLVRSALGPAVLAAVPYEPEPEQAGLTETGLRLGAASFTAHQGRPRRDS